ncbi:unnamed protein product [Heterotrigona itama]|uniref:Uncharacterized protein n=1 Tax=Heterotrigona itama TaxID=395501 RepID=A0A6V7HCS3_9HYME|nr:unnamed protein product [Heterotrigona itama]
MAGFVNDTKKLELKDFLQQQKEQHNKMNVEFSWPDLCKHIPKCVLYRANQIRQIAVKGLGQCSHKVVDQFLMFALEVLVSEDALTNEKFTMLKDRAVNLTFEDAETMLQKFNENVPTDNDGEIAGDIETAGNLFGLKLWCRPAVALTSQAFQILHLKNTGQSVDDSSSTRRREEEMKPVMVKATFDPATYEEKLTEYYEKHSPVISRQAFKDTIIDIIQSDNSESDLFDFLGCEAIELAEYIIENREYIIASDPDLTSAVTQKKCSVVIEELLTLLSKEDKELWTNMEKLGKKLARHQTNERRK